MRTSTERPETIEIGTNNLVGTSIENLKKVYSDLIKTNLCKRQIPELWDGKASERIIDVLLKV
jgi:UDP-N-acetylglucosamine 2-epimerase (non-hydrolysing)